MLPHRFDDMIMNLSIDALINGRIAYTPVGTAGNVPLPGHAVSQIRILYCFAQYIKYICGISDRQAIDIIVAASVRDDSHRSSYRRY